MNNEQQNPQDDEWTMPESSGAAPTPTPLTTQPVPEPVEQLHTEPTPPAPPAPPQNHQSFGSSLIAPQAPSNAPPQAPQKATRHIYGHQKKRTGLGMRLSVAFFGLLLIGGVGYLGMTLLNTGEEKIASTLAVAWGDPVYEGDGSDILKIVSPKSEYTCPEGYGQTGTEEDPTCSKTIVKSVSPINYSCPDGYSKSGEGGSTKCSRIVGGTEVTAAAESVFTCANGFTKSGSGASANCIKTQTSDATKSYSCADSYLLTGEGKESRCVKSDSSQGPINGICPSGYTASGSGLSTVCKQFTAINTATTYSCPSGVESGKGSNMKCIIDATPYSYDCMSGYSGGPTCSKIIYASCQDASIFKMSGSGSSRRCLYTRSAQINNSTSTQTTYSCPYGGSRSGVTCTKYIDKMTACGSGWSTSVTKYGKTCERSATSATTTTYPFSHYSCPWSGYSGSRTSSVCTLQGTIIVPSTSNCYTGTAAHGFAVVNGFDRQCSVYNVPIKQYACSSVPQSSNKCTVNATASTAGSCEAGYAKVGSSCERSATPSFSCNSGFAKVLTSGTTRCLKISMNTIDPSVAVSCPAGMTSVGDNCSKTITEPAKTALVCSSGYKLNGSKCTKIVGGKTETIEPKKSFGCIEDYAQVGEGETMKCVKSIQDVRKMKYELVCEEGWFRREVGSKVDCAKTASGKKPVSAESKQ